MNPSASVVEAVAESKQKRPDELPPLFDVIDPDSLEFLFDRDGANGLVVFEYADRRVRVFSDDTVVVNETPATRAFDDA